MEHQEDKLNIKKMKNIKCELWTIGHSNRSLEEFLELLKEHRIKILVDIRRFPTSKIEHFKKEKMEEWLQKNDIEYIWLGEELGGYRYGGYKKYMKTKSFKNGIEKLLEIAKMKRTCIMCMEINPKYCHRRFISNYLERKMDIKVIHIIKKGQTLL
jgi:uncharacterized protein (DUF488 family)